MDDDILRAPSRNQTLGSLVDAYNTYVDPLLNKYEVLPQIPLIGGMTAGDLGANQIRNIADKISYGTYRPFQNARNIQTLTFDPDTLDVATMVPFGGLAAKFGKPIAKAAGRNAVELSVNKMVDLEQKYGLPTSPFMNIVKPEGNLNLTTRLDEQIKGPETQTVFDLLKQVQGKPGVTKEGLKQIAAKLPDTGTKVTKQQFAEIIPPSQYDKVDLAVDSGDLFENYLQEAMEIMDYRDTFYSLGLPERTHDSFDELVSNQLNYSDLDPETKDVFRRTFGLDETVSDDEAFDVLSDYYMERRNNDAYEHAQELAGDSYEDGYSYRDFQRLVPEKETKGYFELGVTHPDQVGKVYRHYSNESIPEGLIGHVRGTHVKEPTIIEGGFSVPDNSYIIEEIQSDAQKGVDQTGPLHQVHGTLFKAAVQDALEKGADRIYLPTSNPIGAVRGGRGDDYSSIYDKAVIKEGLEPLSKIPGVEIKPVNQRILNSMLEFEDMPMYHEITISPEARENILLGPGQQVPGYAAGGLVASDYDEEQVDRMSDEIFNFEEGGVVDKVARAGRKGQYTLADLVGLKPEVQYATETPERYFPANEQHNARGDAMRHMLFQAQLMQKYGETPAKIIGWMHENLSGPQGDAEKEMDEYNDRLGREIGRVAKDRADMERRALQAIEKRQAKTLSKEQMSQGYAEGGLVYNDEEINNLADQLLGA